MEVVNIWLYQNWRLSAEPAPRCSHAEMHGFLPIPEGGFNNPDVDIVAGVDIDGLYPTLPDELKQTLTRIMEERRYGVFG